MRPLTQIYTHAGNRIALDTKDYELVGKFTPDHNIVYSAETRLKSHAYDNNLPFEGKENGIAT